MSKRLISILVVLVIVLIILGVWITVMLTRAPEQRASAFSAVYLASGDIYFGKLSWFPWPKLTNVWVLQRAVDEKGQTQIGVVPFANAFWGPVNQVSLNPRQVLLWASLREDSQVVKALENPAALQQQQQQQQQLPQGQGQPAPSGNAPAPTPAPKQ
ncbi:MAG: hypothetical protein HY978_02200 [Candidatus Liptonbacteria bacterium]|nr:hypothetical protein [Candidatus Liptonbacteria bacterium]